MTDPREAADVGADGANGAGGGGPRQDRTASPETKHAGKHTRWLYARVLIVQAVTLIALYLLQAAYGSG